MLRTRLAILAIGVALGACAANEPAATPAAPLTAHEQLARGTVFLFEADRATLHITVDVADTTVRTMSLPVAFTGGVVAAATDEQDRLVLSDLTLNHQGLAIPDEDLMDDGIEIGDLVVRMPAPVAFGTTLWSDDDEVAMGNGASGLGHIAWTTETPAGPVSVDRMISLDLSTMIVPADQHIDLVLSAATSTFVWSWGPFTISMDLDYSLAATVDRALG